MKYVKKFESFIQESSVMASPKEAPVIVPPITEPKRPTRPETEKIERPSVDPEPKAEKDVTELDVVKRFIAEVNAKGESVKKYLNK